MSRPATKFEEQVDPAAAATLRVLTNEMVDALLKEARKTCPEGALKDEDLGWAYNRLRPPSEDIRRLRDAQSVVSLALQENRVVEWIAYVMAILFFIFGFVLLTAGVLRQDIWTRTGCLTAGMLVETLLLIPFRFVINCRRHNIALRMLGQLLGNLDDPKKLVPLIEKVFLGVVLEQPPRTPRGKK